MKVSAITSAITQAAFLEAALIVTETDSRDIKFFEAFKDKTIKQILANLNISTGKHISDKWDISNIKFQGKAQWLPANSHRRYWVLSIGEVSADMASINDSSNKKHFNLGDVQIFFADGNTGYICKGYQIGEDRSKNGMLHEFKNAKDLIDYLSWKILHILQCQATLDDIKIKLQDA